MRLRIGYIVDSYNERRNIIGALPDAQYVNLGLQNLSLIRSKIRNRLRNMLSSGVEQPIGDSNFVYNEGGRNKRVDVLHFFNTVSFGPTPWVTTFETIIPRFAQTRESHHGASPDYQDLAGDTEVTEALRALTAPQCLGLVTISECSLRMQLDMLDLVPELKAKVAGKLHVVKPPQRVLVTAEEKAPLFREKKLRLLFVGSSFHRKGGVELIEALKRFKAHHELELTIVSNVQLDNYARQETTEDLAAARRMIQENRSWITHHEQLPNEQVLALMGRAHIGLLPTWADTYGYSVLEFQASGCPVITTDVRALPEINDASTGWLVPVPKNRLGEGIYSTPQGAARMQHAIEEGLGKALEQAFSDRAGLVERSRNAVERIRRDHSFERHAEQLRAIYDTARHVR
ncbi:MAG: glycosyltransferase family 4 protein [Flavobacteriales bacterium]